MTLTNYWWLLIWLFLGGAILGSMPKRWERLGDRTAERWDFLPAFLMVLPYIVWAGFRSGVGDTNMYRRGFLNASADLSQIPMLFTNGSKDPGYTAFLIIVKSVIGNQVELFFLIVATIQMLCVAFVYRRYSQDYWTCIFLFIASTDYMSWMLNGMRQFIAVAIIFAGFKFLVHKRNVPMILLVLLASLFHGSAVLMLPIVWAVQGKAWNLKTLVILATTIAAIVFIDRFTPILNDLLQETQYDDVVSSEIWSNDDGANIIRVLVYSVPALLSLAGLRYIRIADDPVMNICVNCSIVTMALYAIASVTSGIYVGRLPIYTTLQGYLALPWMIDQIFEQRSAKLVRAIMYAAYLVFFYYQMGITWNFL